MSASPLVYLDSSDFSDLSNEKRTSEQEAIRRDLITIARAGEARFVYSGVHLMEMAPLQPGFATRAAAARADLLVELCGRRALATFSKIWEWELSRLGSPDGGPALSVVNEIGEWYPTWDDDLIPARPWDQVWQSFADESKARGLNRADRRKLMPKLARRGRPTQAARALLAQQAQTMEYDQLVRLYPMREHDARTLGNYFIGLATAEDAKEAFLESLRDPRWMIRWFVANADTLSPFTEWVRKPGQDMAERVRGLAQQAKELRAFATTLGLDHEPEVLTTKGWKEAQETFLVNIVTKSRAAMRPDLPACRPLAAEIDQQCPGLSVTIRSAHSAMRASMSAERARNPKGSDFADAIHGLYVPYVDVFRADGFMAEHIAAHAPEGALIVSKLAQVVPAIRRLTA